MIKMIKIIEFIFAADKVMAADCKSVVICFLPSDKLTDNSPYSSYPGG